VGHRSIKTLPGTYLIHREGRIAAAYLGGLVDRSNVEANITTLSPSISSASRVAEQAVLHKLAERASVMIGKETNA
jgi:hypothetical protein